MRFLTLDDLNTGGRVVLLRVDVNSPLDRETGEILDTTRFEQHAPTIQRLRDARLVVMSHQGRPGEYDFTSLERHAHVLSESTEREVRFVDDTFGPCARQEIRDLRRGEVLLLENLRYYSEENLNRPARRSCGN